MSKILVNLPQQTYILRNFYTLGLKDTPCICDECGATIKNVCVIQGMADKQYYNLGTTCVEKHSKQDENFLTNASQYKLKMAKKTSSNINKFIKLYKDVSNNPDVVDKFLTIYIEDMRTNKGIIEHAVISLTWLYDPETQIDRSNENWYLNTGRNFDWDSSRHMKGDITLDLGWIDVEQNSELKEIFSNTKWEYPVEDDFSNDAIVAAYNRGCKDPVFKQTWSNNHFDWFLKNEYPEWYAKSAEIANEIDQLKEEHGVYW